MSNSKHSKLQQHKFWQQQVQKDEYIKLRSLHSAIKEGLIDHVQVEDIYKPDVIKNFIKQNSKDMASNSRASYSNLYNTQ